MLKRFVLLFIIVIFIISFSINILSFEENKMKKQINLSEMTLQEKIGQLVLVKPKKLDNRYLEKLHVGGIFLDDRKTKEDYSKTIEFYQNNSEIELFVATDMEGYWNPFNNFYKSKNLGEINSKKEAYELGKEHGEILKKLGFNLDFSPVVEIRNNVWIGRSFTGSDKEISEKISGYINGLHSEDIMATAKHYPGGNLVKNPHLIKYQVETNKSELEMFDTAINSNVDFIMIGHPVIHGKLNSNKKQATVSPEIIQPLKEKFNGLIITDAITMLGLRISYLFNFRKVYSDAILAGNDIILDTHIQSGYRAIKRRISKLEKAVQEGKISEKRINESLRKILETKGYEVI